MEKQLVEDFCLGKANTTCMCIHACVCVPVCVQAPITLQTLIS